MNKIFNCREGLIVAKIEEVTFKKVSHTDAYFGVTEEELRVKLEFQPEFKVVGKDSIEQDYYDGNIVYMSFRFGKRDDLDNMLVQFGIEPTVDTEQDITKLLEVLKKDTEVVLFTNDNGDWRNYIAPYADHNHTYGTGRRMLHFIENHMILGETKLTKKSSAHEVYEMFKTLVAAEVTTE